MIHRRESKGLRRVTTARESRRQRAPSSRYWLNSIRTTTCINYRYIWHRKWACLWWLYYGQRPQYLMSWLVQGLHLTANGWAYLSDFYLHSWLHFSSVSRVLWILSGEFIFDNTLVCIVGSCCQAPYQGHKSLAPIIDIYKNDRWLGG